MLLLKELFIFCVGFFCVFGFKYSVFLDVLIFYGFSKVIVYKCRWSFIIWDLSLRLDFVMEVFLEYYSLVVKVFWFEAKM